MIAVALALAGHSTAADSEPGRVQQGVIALFDFASLEGEIVNDLSGLEPGLSLRVADSRAVRHTPLGLEILGKTLIRSEKPAARLVEAIKQSGALTIEAWVRPATLEQSGPARIVTLSRNATERNFTLGQEGSKLEVRLRTTATSTNGIPALASKPGSLKAEWTHIVYTRNRQGHARLFVGGALNAEQQIGGETSAWDGGFQLGLGNELSNDRPWQGTLRLVAIYNRDLSEDEVVQNFRAGRAVAPRSAAEIQAQQRAANARLFETRIAPLLSEHCLECHDSLTRKGNLDLSRREAALAAAKGKVVVAGPAAESLIWRKIASDEMPRDRPALSAAEKALIKSWLEEGASWSLDQIDPAIYARGHAPQKVFVQRLTIPEYIASVRETVGVEIEPEARQHLPPDLRADGFSNTAYNLTVDLRHVEAYAKLAEIIAGRIDAKAMIGRHTRSNELTDENITKIIEPVGRRVLRRPLSKEEVARYCGISTTVAATGGNIDEAIRTIIEAMLQSPRFLYRMENHARGPHAGPVDPFELASRLSYIIWGGPPDDALLDAAAKGQLDRAAVRSQAQRMLADRRAVARSRQFVSEWLDLGRLENLRPNSAKFPKWNAQLAADMREETLAFFEEVVWRQNRPMGELLNARYTIVTPRLARHYGLPVEGQPPDDVPMRYDLSNVSGRAGLLTQGSVLSIGGDDASMVARGLFVMQELLRGVVRDPPPGVDTTPPPGKPGLSQRAISETRIANASCAGCHARFEPLAFGLERFDGLGAFREIDEHGNKLREDGEVLFPGQANAVPYKSTVEMLDLLARSDRVRQSFTWKVAQFALGRPLGAEDAPLLAETDRVAHQEGGTYASLLTAIVSSDLVLMSRAEEQP